MSFGFSVGDFIAVGKLALAVYRSCRDAPESFSNISMEVLSLHAVLTEVGELIANQEMLPTKQNSLAVITQGCDSVLKDLQALVLKYEGFGSQSKRTWDRLKWGTKDIAELRSRLISNTLLLTAFMSTFQVVVEKKLNKLAQQFQEGKHEGSVITAVTAESLAYNDQQTWREIRKELENIGISVVAFDSNKDFILEWFQNAISNGAFEESYRAINLGNIESENESDESIESAQEIEFNGRSDFSAIIEEQTSVPPLQQVNTPSQSARPNQASGAPTRLFPKDQSSATSKQIQEPKKKPRLVSLVSWALRYNRSLHEACKKGNFAEAQEYLLKGAQVDGLVDNKPALAFAIERKDIIAANWLLEQGADPNGFDPTSSKGLYLTIALCQIKPDFSMAQLLLDNGADINIQDKTNVRTTLFSAILGGHSEAVGWLVDRGANTKLEGVSGLKAPFQSPFHIAARLQSTIVLQILLDKGERIDVKNRLGQTALHIAAIERYSNLTKWLLDRGANVEEKDGMNRTPLFLAAMGDQIPIAKLLRSRGASVNTRDAKGTAFRQLLQKGFDELGLLFLRWGVDTTEIDKNANNLLHEAAIGNCEKSAEVLLLRGLDPRKRNSQGKSPLDLAQDRGRSVAEILITFDTRRHQMRT